MNLPKYPLLVGDNLMTFQFISEGPKGRIVKFVQFSQASLKGVYNLALVDKDESTGLTDDKVVSNNGDSEKILATVVATVYAFTDKYPDAFVYATGSTKSRTRLYRIGISKHITEIKTDFEIYGELSDRWENFRKGIDYNGFLVRRKNY
jgi:hypothetical protein